jgi:hypothetical protein
VRRVKERSLSSILRSEPLTTLINNYVSGKVNASGYASALDKLRDADVFRVRMGGEKAVSEELVDEKI